MPIVEFQDVSRVYTSGDHELRALDHVNMQLHEGRFIVILGPSGAGKSTLLNLLGGLDSPTEGKIVVDGKDISTLSNNELADYRAQTVGFIFQFYNLVPNLTALENVELAAQVCKDSLDAAETLKKGEKISLLELGSFAIRERKERNGYNPNSKENMVIPAKKVVKFSIGKYFFD